MVSRLLLYQTIEDEGKWVIKYMEKQSIKKPRQKLEKKVESLQTVPKVKLGRPCSVCSHSEIKKINSAISQGKSFRAISCQIQGKESMRESIRRHAENCLKLDIHALLKEKRMEQVIDHYQELIKQLEFSKALQDAVKELLIDTVSGQITFAPRDYEIEVLYLNYADLEPQTGLPKRKKEKLSDIIQSIVAHKSGFNFQGFQVKTINYFDAAVKSIEAVDRVLDKFAKVDGHYQKERENEETLNRVAKAFNNWREDNPDMPVEVLPKWLLRFAENSGVDAKRLADRVGIEI